MHSGKTSAMTAGGADGTKADMPPSRAHPAAMVMSEAEGEAEAALQSELEVRVKGER